MLFQNKLQVSRSQVLQSFWSALMTTKFWKYPKKKKTISDWSKRRVHHTKVTLPIKKLRGHWFDFDSSFVQSKSWNDEEKKYFDVKLRNHAIMAFWMAFFESRSISFLKIATEFFRFANSCAVRLQKQQFIAPKQFTSSWLTNVSVAEFWINRGYYMVARR